MRITTIIALYLFTLLFTINSNININEEVKEVKEHEEVHEVLTVENTNKSYSEELREIARLNDEMFKLCSYDNKHGEIECD